MSNTDHIRTLAILRKHCVTPEPVMMVTGDTQPTTIDLGPLLGDHHYGGVFGALLVNLVSDLHYNVLVGIGPDGAQLSIHMLYVAGAPTARALAAQILKDQSSFAKRLRIGPGDAAMLVQPQDVTGKAISAVAQAVQHAGATVAGAVVIVRSGEQHLAESTAERLGAPYRYLVTREELQEG